MAGEFKRDYARKGVTLLTDKVKDFPMEPIAPTIAKN
jgi:hypothetical protein